MTTLGGHLHGYVFKTAALLLLCLNLNACCRALISSADSVLTSEDSTWMLTNENPARGTAIVIHGLNQRPSTMDTISKLLVGAGFDTYRLTLAGHGNDLTTPVSTQTWRDEVVAAYAAAKTHIPNRPIIFVGYSLGALLIVNVLRDHPELEPKKLILIAPPFSLHTVIHLARISDLFADSDFSIPNLSPAEYRRHSCTPLNWYSKFFEIFDETVSQPLPSHLTSIPAHLFVSTSDEFVSPSGIRDWNEKNQLPPLWSMSLYDPNPMDSGLPGHLMTDSVSLGCTEWLRFSSELQSLISF